MLTAPAGAPAREEGASKTVKLLIDLIQDSVSPGSWKDRGGAAGSIREMNGELIVTQTRNNHAAIDSLLGHLRAYRSLSTSR